MKKLSKTLLIIIGLMVVSGLMFSDGRQELALGSYLDYGSVTADAKLMDFCWAISLISVVLFEGLALGGCLGHWLGSNWTYSECRRLIIQRDLVGNHDSFDDYIRYNEPNFFHRMQANQPVPKQNRMKPPRD